MCASLVGNNSTLPRGPRPVWRNVVEVEERERAPIRRNGPLPVQAASVACVGCSLERILHICVGGPSVHKSLICATIARSRLVIPKESKHEQFSVIAPETRIPPPLRGWPVPIQGSAGSAPTKTPLPVNGKFCCCRDACAVDLI